ncbi:MAG: FlgD immunoglobulin-like domain containing protein [bacterium]|jgi:photosystem II stability/assembly factor-like uncharacterized protein
MSRRSVYIVIAIAAVAAFIWAAMEPANEGRITTEESVRLARQFKKSMKAEWAAQGKRYEPGAFPSEWAWRQRIYPYDRFDFEQLKQAVVQAQAMRIAARKMPAALSAAWVERGPTNIGARVSDIVFHPVNTQVIYAAISSGGVLRSDDGGASWTPITDDLPVITIGAIAIDPEDPDVIYVGTGEANAQSFSWFGMGLYKSTDAGATWTYKGLEETRYIARIVVDPANPERVWVAGTGALFGTNPERGIYRSLDAGESWELVLAVSDSTAGTDVAVDPERPDTVYAAMWERVRGLNYRKSAGHSSGIYRSFDGGETWHELTTGLPSGSDVGRIGISVCESNPAVIYAIYADDPGYFAGVFKSVNGGDTWTQTNDEDLEDLYSSFGWYFGQIRVDPGNPNRVFAMGVPAYRSENGGSSWSEVGASMHVDHHAMDFDPTDYSRIVEGNDGGIYTSTNSGDSWTKRYDQHTNQFYAIEIDYQNPSRLYGGTQDNGTLRTVTGDPDDWEAIFGGDGFYCNVDPTDSDKIFVEYQYGNLYYSDDFADSWLRVMDGINSGDRRNWSTPVVMEPGNPSTMYYGTYRVYKTVDRGSWWSAISGDLTGGNAGAGFGTITTIAVSPTDTDVIYVGTDDSNVWVTSNGGGAWTDISATLPDRWVTRVFVDPADENLAYVTFSGLRWDENIGYVYFTDDMGATWTDITGNLPAAPVNALVVDPALTSRVIVGTDVGCFYSDCRNGNWLLCGTGMPPVPVYDLKTHSPTRTLVAGTHGRSMYSLDLSGLPDSAAVPAGETAGVIDLVNHPNPFTSSTTVTFALPEASSVSLEVYDLAGRKVRTLSAGRRGAGTHRVTWDGTNESGRRVASGIYFLKVDTAQGTATRPLNLVR